MARSRAFSHERVAWGYEAIARVYSAGAIGASKSSQIRRLRSGDRVLYAGVGGGEDAIRAVRAGAEVTALDLAPRMLDRLRGRLEREGLSARLLCEDFFDHEPERAYDAVIANYFLNIFGESEMRAALARLVSMCAPNGRVMIADFAPYGGCDDGRWARVGRALYYRPVNIAAWALRLCELHPIYDYAPVLASLGFSEIEREGFGVGGRGPEFYVSWVAQRSGTPS